MKKSKNIALVLGIVSLFVGVLASINLFTNRGFSFHDEAQIAYLFEYSKVISMGQFPPRWAPDMHFTYGSPFLEFNYQIPYYLGVAFHNIGLSLLDSYKLVLGLSLVIGAVGIYLLGLLISGPLAGLAAAILFTFTPYRAVDIFVRGTVGESLGIAIYPWIVLSLVRLKNKSTIFNTALVAVSVSALLLTHQPASVFGLPIIFGIFALSEIIKRNFNFLVKLAISLIGALCLSSYYLLPVLFEQKLITPLSPFNFYDHFPFIWQFFRSKWGYGSSNWGPYDDLSFQVGLANIAVIVISGFSLIWWLTQKRKVEKIYLFSSMIGVGITFFLMNNRSSFLWEVFPYTNLIQFPWRLLAIMSLLTVLLYIYLLKSSRGLAYKILLLAIPAVALSTTFLYFRPGTVVDHSDSYYLRRYLPNQVLNHSERISADYLNFTEESIPLPKTATRPKETPPQTITSSQIETRIKIDTDNPFNTKATIESPTGGFITIHRFYFPGWIVKINGEIQKINLNNNGAMVIFVPRGNHQLSVSYQNTLVRNIGNLISFWTALATIIIVVNYFYTQHGRKK